MSLKSNSKIIPSGLIISNIAKNLLRSWMNNAKVSLNQENSTNNCIESYHRTIKIKFIKSIRKHTPDDLLCVLYKEVTLLYEVV